MRLTELLSEKLRFYISWFEWILLKRKYHFYPYFLFLFCIPFHKWRIVEYPKSRWFFIECLDWLLLSHNPLWNFTQSCGWINIHSLSVPLFKIRKKSLTVLFIQWECFLIERFVQQSSLVNSLLCLDFYCSHCFAFSRSLTWVGDVLLTDLYFLRNKHHD